MAKQDKVGMALIGIWRLGGYHRQYRPEKQEGKIGDLLRENARENGRPSAKVWMRSKRRAFEDVPEAR